MTKKLDQSKIDEIKQLSSKWLSRKEIVELLGVWSTSVHKYLKDIEVSKTSIVETLNKEQIKKLELTKNLSSKQIEEILYHNAIATKTDNVNIQTEATWHAIFWAIGDTHLGSKHCNYEWLEKYYEEINKRGIKTVVHAWDMVDWFGVYKGQTFELSKHSMDEQINDVIENYPKVSWVDTYWIGWNHDEARLKIAWYDISKGIDNIRTDMHNLWRYNARLKLNGVDIELHHWWWGNSYSRSYKPQKYLENTNPKDQPNVYVLWHFHSALYMFYRKIHAFMAGSFQWETLLSKRFKLGNVQWWWIVEVELDGNGWTIINMEFIKI